MKHPFEIHECSSCPDSHCAEGFKINKFKPTKCGNCYHVHARLGKHPYVSVCHFWRRHFHPPDKTDKFPPPATAPAAPVPAPTRGMSIGQRFFPSGAGKAPKIAGLTAHFVETRVETPRETAARLREERAAAKAAKEKEEKMKAKAAPKPRRNTVDLRVKVGNAPVNPVFGDDFDAFHDPYMLMPVEDPHDDNVRCLCHGSHAVYCLHRQDRA